MCLFVSFYVLVAFSMRRFSFWKEFSKISRRFHVFKKAARHLCLILNKPDISWQIKIEVSYTKFHKKKNMSSALFFHAGGRTDTKQLHDHRQVEQNRHSTYNVTLTRVRATIVTVENQWVLHNLSVCICNLRYPACNAHAPYYHLWSAPLYSIFPRHLINRMIIEKKILNTKCVFWFSLQILSETFLILIRNERNMITNVHSSSRKVPVILVRF